MGNTEIVEGEKKIFFGEQKNNFEIEILTFE